MNKKSYEVLHALTATKLTEKVNAAISQGYRPTGGVARCLLGYSQAVVLPIEYVVDLTTRATGLDAELEKQLRRLR